MEASSETTKAKSLYALNVWAAGKSVNILLYSRTPILLQFEKANPLIKFNYA